MNANRPRSHDTPPDGPQYVQAWARDILAAIGKRATRRLLSDYKGLAEKRRLSKTDRQIAADRAEALEQVLRGKSKR